jgi:hypothetical protein
MTSRFKNAVLVLVLAAWTSGATAQDDCGAKINNIQKIGDMKAALGCLEGHIAAERERTRQDAEKSRQKLIEQLAGMEVLTTKVRNMPLNEVTNGIWKEIPESNGAAACFLSSIRLPPQGLCQVTYQGTIQEWSYNVSNPGAAGFMCTATCIWVQLQGKPPATPAAPEQSSSLPAR